MADQKRIVVEVNAGPHDRKNCFVSFATDCACDCEAGHVVEELDAQGNAVKQIAAQCLTDACGCEEDDCSCGCGCEVAWMVDELKAGQSKRYAISVGSAPADGGVTIDLQDARQADFTVNGELFTSYVFQEGIARPFCCTYFPPPHELEPGTSFACSVCHRRMRLLLQHDAYYAKLIPATTTPLP